MNKGSNTTDQTGIHPAEETKTAVKDPLHSDKVMEIMRERPSFIIRHGTGLLFIVLLIAAIAWLLLKPLSL